VPASAVDIDGIRRAEADRSTPQRQSASRRKMPIEPESRRNPGELARRHAGEDVRLTAHERHASTGADVRQADCRSNPRAAEYLDFVTDRVRFDTFSGAFEALKKPSDQIKVMLEPH
jgi:hypothetical protein